MTGGADSSSSAAKRAKVEAANRDELLRKLPAELWQKIVDENVQQNDLFALAMTCRFFREKQKDLGKKMVTDLNTDHLFELQESGEVASHTLGWFQWVCDTFEILPGFEAPVSRFGSKRVKGAVYKGDLVNYAAFQGSVEILRWLVEEKGWETNWRTGEWAGMSGSIEVLEYLKERGYEFNVMACAGAARGGHLKALKWLRAQDPPCPWDERTCALAAKGGHLGVLKWSRSQDPPCPWGGETCGRAAREGRLDVLQWLRSQDPPCPWGEWTCSEAAGGGHLDVLKFLRSEDPPCPWDEMTFANAAEGGHLDVLKFLRDQDLLRPWSESTCFGAARGGNLEVLKWARSQDPPSHWSAGTCHEAVRGGHLEVLKWLRAEEPPCPWSRNGCRFDASYSGHHHVVNWIDQQEDESDLEYSDWEYSDRSYDSYSDESL